MSRRCKYLQVREHVRSVILAASPGSRAPSERELVERFGVARMTVRHALDGLVAQGLLERIPGRGTFVTRPSVDMQMRLSSFTEEMERRGKQPTSQTLAVRAERAGPGLARALEADDGVPLVHWERLRLADGDALAIQHVYLPAEMFPDFLEGEPPVSLYRMLAERGLMPTWGEDSVRAAGASVNEAARLEIEPGDPVLHISRRAFYRDLAVEVSRSVYRADRYTLWVPVLRPEP